jgi:ribonuclease G
MSKEMIVSVNGREKKIAILDNGKVTEFYIERGEENSGIAGNIYKGRVQRVLPGMQSAFVSIGLERDAFLYVSDFFDEEEEIERIVMEKSKKITPEEAKREANEQIDRARVNREKQMEAVQEIAEPLASAPIDEQPEVVAPDQADQVEADPRRREKGGRSRGRKGREERVPVEPIAEAEPFEFKFEIEDSGFERIIDDSDTGEMFKDAFMQEAIVDQVRAVEFEMEGIADAEVGSLLGSEIAQPSGFERIADEDDDPAPAKESKGRGGTRTGAAKPPAKSKSKKTKVEAKGDDESVLADSEATAKKPGKGKVTRGKSKRAEAIEVLEDADVALKEPSDSAEMSVRRGGRGRRRGGRNKRPDETATTETGDTDSAEGNEIEEIESRESRDSDIGSIEAIPENGNIRIEGGDEAETEDGVSAKAETSRAAGETRGGENRREGWEDRNRRGGRNDRSRSQGDGRKFDRNDRGDKRERAPQPTISDLLREGQEILVQIAKEPIARKGARITSHIALPGRFLVYMPTIEHLGVSRKIESSSERGRLRTLIQRIRQDEDIPSGGFIVRTAGIGISEEDLRQDARYLVRTWQDIKKTSEKAKSPAVVHQDLDIVQRLLRDQMSDDFTAIRVDSEDEYLRTVEFMNRIQPRMVNRVKLYTRDEPILDAYGVQEEIEKALKPRVWLKSGGYLVINQTEALVAIDVNTGKFVGKGNARLEDTITRTNLEAVDEIARQIRLRDLGGIIVLDLIDMEDRRNRHRVSQALQEALSSDKSPTKVLSFNDFGLIIMTRKRVKQSLERTLCTVCEYCEGSGWVKSPQTICFEILAEARRLSRDSEDVRQTTLRAHPDVIKALRTTERAVLEEIEAYLDSVDLTADPTIHQAQFDFALV